MSDFEDVLKNEKHHITEARKCYNLPGDAEGKLGLALSGGGVRSATFNLGVIQAVAKLELLKRFDYLSTVSGGGYIGSWLSAWCHRHPQGVYGVEQALAGTSTTSISAADRHKSSETIDSEVPMEATTPTSAADRHEPDEVSWLRQYSNYLTPRTGLFSLDTWTGIAFYGYQLKAGQLQSTLMCTV